MSAETVVLREAAKAMREQHGPEHPRHEMWAAMADLLEARLAVWLDDVPVSHDAHALAVASAYIDATAVKGGAE